MMTRTMAVIYEIFKQWNICVRLLEPFNSTRKLRQFNLFDQPYQTRNYIIIYAALASLHQLGRCQRGKTMKKKKIETKIVAERSINVPFFSSLFLCSLYCLPITFFFFSNLRLALICYR